MKEYIFQLNDALFNQETGEAVFKPKVAGELIRCHDCKWWEPYPDNAITPEAHKCRRSPFVQMHTEEWEYCARASRKD